MNKLKVCFIGVGSIAKRHIRNLLTICNEKKTEVTIDAFRRVPEKIDGINNVHSSIFDMPSDYDIIFITNPTEIHLQTLRRFHEKGKHFFIEKPVVALSQIEDAKRFQTREESIYYVASPLRYSAVIQWIKNNVALSDVISVRSISSSYLPDWRPGQDYRDTYSAHKELGGGVSIDLIHEWDYLTYLFGWPKKIQGFIGKKSDLEISSDDYAIYIAEYEKMLVELHLDYFGRKKLREIQMFTREDTIVGNIEDNKIQYLKSGETIDFNERRDDYHRRELEGFLHMVHDDLIRDDSFHYGLRVLELTQGRLPK